MRVICVILDTWPPIVHGLLELSPELTLQLMHKPMAEVTKSHRAKLTLRLMHEPVAAVTKSHRSTLTLYLMHEPVVRRVKQSLAVSTAAL